MPIATRLLVATFFILTPHAFAEEGESNGGIAKIIVASPTTTFEGKKILDGATLGTLGTLKTGREGGAKIKILENEVSLDIGANSEIKIVRPTVGEPSEVIELVSGMARAHVQALKSPTKERAARPAGLPTMTAR